MPPFRNPFNKRPPLANDLAPVNDENRRPSLAADAASQTSSYGGSRTSSSLSIKRREEPSEYKLSGEYSPSLEPDKLSLTRHNAVVNDSGVYLPVSMLHAFMLNRSYGNAYDPPAFTNRKERLLAQINNIGKKLESSEDA